MSLKKVLTWASVLAAASAVIGALPGRVAAQSNLLQNPGMEQPYENNKQPNSWGRWFWEIQKPNDASALQYAVKPNFSAETNASGKHPELVFDGSASAHVGQQYDPWIGGLSQVVNNIPPGSQVRFCAYSRLYAQNTDYGKGGPSVTGMEGRSQVGVYLDGSVTWDNPGVVWSGTANPHDNWQNICVTAGPVGSSGTVTVFTRNDWRGSGAVHLDSWWDDAELVTVGTQPTPQPTNAPAAQPAQPQTQPQPQSKPVTPDATGAVVYTIVAGDTLFALSLQYNVPLDQLYALNNLNSQSILSIGQKIIIKPGAGTSVPAQPQATTVPAAAPTQAPAAASQATPAAGTPEAAQPAGASTTGTPVADTSSSGKLCVFAFDDVNGDGLRQPSEAPVAGAKFSVVDSQGTAVGDYVSTDSTQPYCFKNLTAGSYTVSVQPAPETTATSDKRWGVALTGGSTINIDFGSRGATEANTTASSGTTSTSKPASNSSIGGLLGGAVGLVLLLVAGVLGAFIIARRRG